MLLGEGKKCCDSLEDEYEEMTVNTIINGKVVNNNRFFLLRTSSPRFRKLVIKQIAKNL